MKIFMAYIGTKSSINEALSLLGAVLTQHTDTFSNLKLQQ